MKYFFAIAFIFAAALAKADVNVPFGIIGSWFNPSTNGQGFDFEVNMRNDGTNDVTAYWYTYDGLGTKQIWLIAGGPLINATANMIILRPTGGKFNNGFPKPTGATVGTLNLTLTSCTTANIDWTMNQSFEGIGTAKTTLALTKLSPPMTINGKDLCATPVSQFDTGALQAEYNSLNSDYNTLYNNYNTVNGYYQTALSDFNYDEDLLGHACEQIEHLQSAAYYYDMPTYGDYDNLVQYMSNIRYYVCGSSNGSKSALKSALVKFGYDKQFSNPKLKFVNPQGPTNIVKAISDLSMPNPSGSVKRH